MKNGTEDLVTGRQGKASPSLPVITLLTDFGTADYYVGAVKGAILSVNPLAVIADLTHDIPPQDIEAGAFTLLASYKTFPQLHLRSRAFTSNVSHHGREILPTFADLDVSWT